MKHQVAVRLTHEQIKSVIIKNTETQNSGVLSQPNKDHPLKYYRAKLCKSVTQACTGNVTEEEKQRDVGKLPCIPF